MYDLLMLIRVFLVLALGGFLIWILVLFAQARRRPGPLRTLPVVIALAGLLVSLLTLVLDLPRLLIDFPGEPTDAGPIREVQIAYPQPDEPVVVESNGRGGAQLSVWGTCSGGKPEAGPYVYVLVHPVKPYASGWWVSNPASVDPDGGWTTVVWLGSEMSPVQPDCQFELIAVAAPKQAQIPQPISGPEVLTPYARSPSVSFNVDQVREPTHTPTLTNTPTLTSSPTNRVWNCHGDLYSCGDFSSCAEVMSYWRACPGDPSHLDSHHDGRLCESLCR